MDSKRPKKVSVERRTRHTLNKRHMGDVAEVTVSMLANLSVLQVALGRAAQFNWALTPWFAFGLCMTKKKWLCFLYCPFAICEEKVAVKKKVVTSGKCQTGVRDFKSRVLVSELAHHTISVLHLGTLREL